MRMQPGMSRRAAGLSAEMPRQPRLRDLPVVALVPSIITVFALLAGLTAMRYALDGQWRMAIAAIIVAALADGMDGRMARLLNSTSRFGAELDSLADFVSFGVAPAMLLYLWTLHEAGGQGWAAVLFYATCAALRLARFNAEIDPPSPPAAWRRNFFTGVPAPAAGGLALFWVYLSLATGWDLWSSPWINGIWLVVVGLLMISRLPTFSVKKARLRRDRVLPALLGVALVAATVVSLPWWSLVAISLAYLASLPIAWFAAARQAAAAESA